MESENKSQEYLVTARKWRPLKFSDVVGQEHITQTLQNAIKTGRIHHAYLFSGPRGVGKTTTARILARALNCTDFQNLEPCNHCESCTSIIDGRSLDVIEIDGASNNSVEDIRKLRENSKYLPSAGKYKMYIIDEVHMLSTSAFNALLKTLEEPPAHLLFVFATTEPHKVPATILSRCQRFEFRRMEIPDIAKQLRLISDSEGIHIDDKSLVTIAKKGDGSMRDSQSIFDQVIAFCGMDIKYAEMTDALHLIDSDFFFKITDAIKSHDLNLMFEISNQVSAKGYDLQECLEGLLEHLRNILAAKVSKSIIFLDTSKDTAGQYLKEAESFSKTDLLTYLNIISKAEQSLKYAPQPKIRFELALLQIASMDTGFEIQTLIQEIRSLRNSNTIPNHVTRTDMNSAQIPAVNQNLAATTKPLNDDTTIPNSGKTDPDSLRSSWNSFVNNYANSSTGLYILKNTEFYGVEFLYAEIIIKCKNYFVYDSVKNAANELMTSLEKFYGSKIETKIINIEDLNSTESKSTKVNPVNIIPAKENILSTSATNNETTNSANIKFEEHKEEYDIINNIFDLEKNKLHKEKQINTSNHVNHPVEQQIIDLFGANQVND